jgi:acetylornithine deacetylase
MMRGLAGTHPVAATCDMAIVLTPRQILDRLVAFPTVSRDTNLPLIDWVEAYLAGHGVTASRQWHPDGTKAGLFAQVGDGPGAVVLSGHSDVVPVDGQAWASDPWTVTERDGRLFGRGCVDMKGFVALSLWAMVEARRHGLARPMQLALSYDEEIGCTGGDAVIAAMKAGLPMARAVIVGEPTMMGVVTGHKGGAGMVVRFRGHEVHSSLLPQGVSAVMEAGRFLMWANDVNAASMAALPSATAALFDPPFSTLHAGMIRGGTAHNITAADCEVTFEVRVVPGESTEGWLARIAVEARRIAAAMRAVHPQAGVDIAPLFAIPPLVPEAGGAAEALARRLTGDNALRTVSYGTEGGQFQAQGYSAVVCGPGDIAQAHQPDEFITIAQFQAGQAFMERLLAELR